MSGINGDKARDALQRRRRNVQRMLDRAARAKGGYNKAAVKPTRERSKPSR
jgi:hypothetical protein